MKPKLVLLTILFSLITERQAEAANYRLMCYQYSNLTGATATYNDTQDDITKIFPNGPQACKVKGSVIFYAEKNHWGEANTFHGNNELYFPRERFPVASLKVLDKNGLYVFDDGGFNSAMKYFSKETRNINNYLYVYSAVVIGPQDWTVESKCTKPNCNQNVFTCIEAAKSGQASFVSRMIYLDLGEVVSVLPGKCWGTKVSGKTRIPECLCNQGGVFDDANKCDGIQGQCKCQANHTGYDCDWCISTHGLKENGKCVELGNCGCDPRGVNNFDYSCSGDGKCNCHWSARGDKCNQCGSNYAWKKGKCKYCNCPISKVDRKNACDDNTGKCNCKPMYKDDKCESCANGYTAFRQLCITAQQQGLLDLLKSYWKNHETDKNKVLKVLTDLYNSGITDFITYHKHQIGQGLVTPEEGARLAYNGIGNN